MYPSKSLNSSIVGLKIGMPREALGSSSGVNQREPGAGGISWVCSCWKLQVVEDRGDASGSGSLVGFDVSYYYVVQSSEPVDE